ncbi:YncE family protein, partial [Mycobacterium tuberculosis]
ADQATASASSTAVQRKAIAQGLYELAFSPKQNAVFVASSGGFGDAAGPSQVLRLNPETLAVETAIPLERKAFGVVLDDANNRLYVGNTVDTSVTVVDTATNKSVGIVQLMEKKVGKDGKAAYTHDLRELVVDGANNRLYVTGHSGEGSVLFVVD